MIYKIYCVIQCVTTGYGKDELIILSFILVINNNTYLIFIINYKTVTIIIILKFIILAKHIIYNF